MSLDWLLSRRLTVIVPVLAMLGILGLSSVPGTIPEHAPAAYQVFVWVPPSIQNLAHIPVYAALAFLWNWTLAGSMGRTAAGVTALLIAVCFGMFDEWYQSFIPGRYPSWMDVAFNTVGAALGVLVFRWLAPRR